MTAKRANAQAVRPYQDYGLFGPGSVVWKVNLYPTSFTIGFQRTVVTEMFEPYLLASVQDTGAVRNRPAVRYDRTMQYVSTVAFADGASIARAADVLFRIHSRIRGQEPISGGYYDANDPEAQLWIHLTQWHSVLLTYELFGPGPLPPEEETEYWAACRKAATFQTIDPETVPANRAEMRAYYERMRPKLAATEATQELVHHLLDASAFLLDDLPLPVRPLAAAMRLAFRKATIASLPYWMRRMGGIRQSSVEDRWAIGVMRAGLRSLSLLPATQQLRVLAMTSPAAAKVMAPILLDIKPENPQPVTPEQVWAATGLVPPREQYARWMQQRAEIPDQHAPADPGAGQLLQFG